MTDLTPPPITVDGYTTFEVGSPNAVASALSAQTSVVVAGLMVARFGSDLNYVQKYVGEQNVPQDIKRMRRSVFELMRRMGTPVVVKHMWNDRDVAEGIAQDSPNFDRVYGHTRGNDTISHGVGFVSKEESDDEWITSGGDVVADEPTGAPFAPKYRGFGPGFLTWIIEPDAMEDFYKHDPTGVFIRVQNATVQAPWWPDISDNDLIVHVTLDDLGSVTAVGERYQAKMTNPVSLRGTDRRGRREYSADTGNRHLVNQTFEMALLPRQHQYYQVEIDR